MKNLGGRETSPEILRAGGGAIVNTGTLAAVIGRGGSPCYGAAKSGVLSLTRAQARQSDQGLTKPEEIAPVFLFLASDQLSRKVTGHILLAENGYSILRL